MKTKLMLILAGLALGAAVPAFAGPPSKQFYDTLRREAQFSQLKPGERIVYVCKQCEAVTETTVESAAQAMEHCKAGATATCPACHAKTRVVLKGMPKSPDPQRVIVYTNDKGEACMFIAKVVSNK